MESKESIDLFNKNCIGTKVVYWPTLLLSSHKNGKRTLTRSKAFLSKSGSPVVFLEGISGYVHVGCVEIGSLMREDSTCFDSEFGHKW